MASVRADDDPQASEYAEKDSPAAQYAPPNRRRDCGKSHPSKIHGRSGLRALRDAAPLAAQGDEATIFSISLSVSPLEIAFCIFLSIRRSSYVPTLPL